jgi:PTH1 family peptidyl-tRNA hydrolase
LQYGCGFFLYLVSLFVMADTPLQLIVGLGNPGPEHQLTRHNAGFWLLDALAQSQGQRFRNHAKFHGEICRVALGGAEVTLLKPGTYMNRSGLAVRAAADYHKIPPAQIMIAHDELDLPSCTLRFKLGGGHGGHNGLRDVIPNIGPDFWRLRIGIGHPGDKTQVIDYLLKSAPARELENLFDCVHDAAKLVPDFIQLGAEKVMNSLHSARDSNGD